MIPFVYLQTASGIFFFNMKNISGQELDDMFI